MTKITGHNWKRFFGKLYERSLDADIFGRAAQVAFYFSFSIFPLLYFLVSLFGLVLTSSVDLKHELYVYLHEFMPVAVYDLVAKTVDEIVANSSGGKATLGLVELLVGVSRRGRNFETALNAVYKFDERRPWWRTKVQSLIVTLFIAILSSIVLATVFYGWQLVQYGLGRLGLEVSSPFILVAIQWGATLLVMLIICEIIYSFLPAFKKFRWIWVTPGSFVAILLWILLTGGFRLYLSFFDSYNRAYGSLGAVIIMMLWLYLTASALLVGGAINSVLPVLLDTDAKAPDKA